MKLKTWTKSVLFLLKHPAANEECAERHAAVSI